jgi:hypothetical protein
MLSQMSASTDRNTNTSGIIDEQQRIAQTAL